jgi:hypothetical protein
VTNPTYCLELPNSANTSGYVLANNYYIYSDERLKSDRQPLKYGLQTIMQLKPQQYFQHNSTSDSTGINIKKDEGATTFGLLAQEAYKVVPEMVHRPADDSKELWTIDYSKLGPILVKAVQEQEKKIEDLQTQKEQTTDINDRFKRLELENALLKARIETLEKVK